jgi:protein gp37
MKVYPQPALHFAEKEMNCNLGEGNYIFVGSSTDMFAETVPNLWIYETLEHCRKFNNKYLFQTKNPARLMEFSDYYPDNILLACTIETNRFYDISKAPPVEDRFTAMANISLPKMISIEPILMFDLIPFFDMIHTINPEFVSVGADSKNHHLPEPDAGEVVVLIEALKKFTQVIEKPNLKRIRGT